jgi:hypothetical protein
MWHSQALAGLIFGWDTTPEERAVFATLKK